MEREYANDEILEMLRACKNQHGKCTTRLFREQDDFCSVSLVMKRFGSWTEAKKEAGIDEDLSSETGRRKQYTDEQILSHLRECKRKHGKCTTKTLQEDDELVGPTTVVERFGSWLEAKKQAGIDIDERDYNSRPREYSDEELLESLRECQKTHGKCTQRVFDQDDEFPSSGAIRKRFGSWSEAKELAGLEVEDQTYSDEELLHMLRRCADKYGTCSSRQFASDDEFSSTETVLRRFGSWSDAKEKALSGGEE